MRWLILVHRLALLRTRLAFLAAEQFPEVFVQALTNLWRILATRSTCDRGEFVGAVSTLAPAPGLRREQSPRPQTMVCLGAKRDQVSR